MTLKLITYSYILLLCLNPLFAQNKILINELLSSNINGLVDNESGEYSDWIELYNPNDSLVDISGFYLSDKHEDPFLWRFPNNTFIDSNSFLIVWADDKNYELHTNFKLSNDGEKLFLYSKDSVLVDSITYGKQRDDVSVGRDTSNFEWLFFDEPTPGKMNLTKRVRPITNFLINQYFQLKADFIHQV
ncbi:MAG: lamin tail domain-containing protein [Ignavibacteriales bacterium]|nr:lamin tail domain-containing protein [Ignavibacteriales bacterium]